MKRLWLLVLVFSFFSNQKIYGQHDNKYYRLRSLWKASNTLMVYDVNDDGVDELFCRGNDVQIDIYDWTNKRHHDSFAFSRDKKHSVAPIPGTSFDSLYFLVRYTLEDTIRFSIVSRINRNNSALMSETPFDKPVAIRQVSQEKVTNTNLWPLAGLKIHDNRSRYFFFDTDYDQLSKRGLAKINIASLSIDWLCTFGPQPRNILLQDIDDDSIDEILFGSYASNNGLTFSGSGDDSSFVFVLSNDGQIKWRKSFGGFYTGSYVTAGDFWGDGEIAVLVAKYGAESNERERDVIYLLSPINGEIVRQRQVGEKMTLPNIIHSEQFCHDFDGDGRDEFVVGNSDGYVRLFNGELNEEKVSQKFHKPIYVACVADINNDKRLEVVCYIDSDRILVLDNNLNLLHEHLLEGRELIRLTPFRREKDTLLFSRAGFPGQPAHYELLQFEESKFPFSDVNETRITNWLLIAGALFIFLLLVIYLTRRGLLFHAFLHLLQQAQLYEQSLLLTKSRRIKGSGSNWVDILNNRSDSLVGKTLSSINSTNEPLVDLLKEMINSKQGERLFSATIDGEVKPIRIRLRFLPALRLYNFMVFDITVQDHIKQIQLWAKVAQKLAHGIKNPLTSVKLNAEELRDYLREKCLLDEEEVSDYIQSITNQVDKLKRMSDGFMRFVEFDKPQLKAYSMNQLIEELVAQWKPTESSGIRIGLDLAEDVPTALLDKEQFIYAFQNIFFNAVQSIEGSGHIDISTRLLHSIAEVGAHKTAFVELRVQDTGVGIPPEYLDKITQPYFTTKKDGTGLGLSIVEKIVDSHDGMFDIQSRMHEGTTVTMRWRAKT